MRIGGREGNGEAEADGETTAPELEVAGGTADVVAPSPASTTTMGTMTMYVAPFCGALVSRSVMVS